MGILKLIWKDKTIEKFKTKNIDSASKIIRRRNAPSIEAAFFNGKEVDLEPYKDMYGRPAAFLRYVESILDIQAAYRRKK